VSAAERVARRPAAAVALRRLRAEQIVDALPPVAAVFSMVGFVVAGYFRITFAYPMWVMETPAMQAIRRILSQQPLYAPPSLEYVAPLYAPVYFFVSALFAHLIGANLGAPRLVSLFASLGCAALVGYLAWAETRRTYAAVVAAGLFISTTALASLTLDLARVDPLMLLFLLGAVTCCRGARRRVWLSAAGGVLSALAVFTKQTAIAMVLPLVLIPLLDRRFLSTAAYLLAMVIVLGLGTVALYAAYGRWAEYFLILLPSRHTLTLAQAGVFWSQKILPAATVPLLLAPVYLIGRWLSRDVRAVRFWVLVGAGMLGMSWVATMNQWSDDNVLLPSFAVLSVMAVLGIDEAQRRLRVAGPFRTYLVALLALEFVIVAYNPRQTSPLRSDVSGLDRLVAGISGIPGRVFAPDFPELAFAAGKGDSAFGIGLLELTGGFGGKPLPESSAWIAAYRTALNQRFYDALLLDPDGVEPFITDEATSSGYVDTGPLFKPNDVFYSYGSRYAPKAHLWLPRERV
jgi:hypothetical protein